MCIEVIVDLLKVEKVEIVAAEFVHHCGVVLLHLRGHAGGKLRFIEQTAPILHAQGFHVPLYTRCANRLELAAVYVDRYERLYVAFGCV